MASATFRLELSTEQTKNLIAQLIDGLAAKSGISRIGVEVVLYEDDTRRGQRNGHGITVRVDQQSTASLYATAYDVQVSEVQA